MSELIYLVDDLESVILRIMSDKELIDCALTEDNIKRTIYSFKGDEIACSVFLKKYALRDENDKIVEFTLEEAKDRWANAIVEAERIFGADEEKVNKMKSEFRELYDYMLPAGRQMFALGNSIQKNLTYSNCYVTGLDDDSIIGIYDCAKRMAKTYSYGGGIGTCIGNLRPRNAKVSNSAKFSTGSVSFMELFSLTTGLIGQNSRRGALMLTMPVNHPDIEEFIEIKHNNINKVKHANISIKITDEFMNAVLNNSDFNIEFKTKHENMKKAVNARHLWNKIVQAARDSAEPGLMFWSRAVDRSPSDRYDALKIFSSNPCSEIMLEKNGACVLSSLLLHRFVKNPFTEDAEFDFDLFVKMTKLGIRHLDNIVELNVEKHALEEQKQAAILGRRIGLGITGLADTLSALRIRYDSEQALEFVEKISKLKMENEYIASIDLSKERGPFKLFDAKLHYEKGFCLDLPEYIKEKGRKYGQRNVTLSTIAPSGSLSIIAHCSGGIEPVFAFKYKRFTELGTNTRKEFTVHHQGLTRCFKSSGTDSIPDYWVEAHNIDWKFRVKLQGIMQKYIDSSISSTINLPSDVTTEEVSDIYINAWKEGLKGITVYREGSREGVLVTDEFARQASIETDTIIYKFRAEGGDKFYIPVSYKNGDLRNPYQVFVLNYKAQENDRFIKISNELIKMLREKGVDPDRIDKYIDRSYNSVVKLTRFISLSMKTGNFEDCMKVLENHAFAGTLAAELHKIFSRSVNSIKNACPECSGTNMRMEEGCAKCLDCGTTLCG